MTNARTCLYCCGRDAQEKRSHGSRLDVAAPRLYASPGGAKTAVGMVSTAALPASAGAPCAQKLHPLPRHSVHAGFTSTAAAAGAGAPPAAGVPHEPQNCPKKRELARGCQHGASGKRRSAPHLTPNLANSGQPERRPVGSRTAHRRTCCPLFQLPKMARCSLGVPKSRLELSVTSPKKFGGAATATGMSYVEVSDEDRRWAANAHDHETVYRGPCGQLFVWIDQSIETIKEQSPVQNMLLVLAFFFLGALGNILLEDETVTVMVRGGAACAAPKDLLDQEHQRCRTEDKLALAYLHGETWASCSPSSMVCRRLPAHSGASILPSSCPRTTLVFRLSARCFSVRSRVRER